jgi:hypothetical protein
MKRRDTKKRLKKAGVKLVGKAMVNADSPLGKLLRGRQHAGPITSYSEIRSVSGPSI